MSTTHQPRPSDHQHSGPSSSYSPQRAAPPPPQRTRTRPSEHPSSSSQQQSQPRGSSEQQTRPAESRPLKKQGSERRADDVKRIGPWKIGRTIGKGSSGRVKLAKHSVTGQYAAVKIVPKNAILNSRMSISEAGAKSDKILLGIEREIVIMKLIDHPNVMNLFDVWETNGELYLIMEYVPGGELFDYLVSRGRLPPQEALHYFQQIINAVDYCHRFNICHRDLKPENLLLDSDKNIKVADFGMAAWQAGEQLLETSCGSPHYASPEIVAGKAYNGGSSDIWSCGVILFALLSGRLPFDDDNIRVLLQKVKVGSFEMPNEIQGTARDLLFRMLDKNPVTRITMPQIIRHPFFVSVAPRPIPGRAFVHPPSLDEIERPVNSVDDIDPDILGNLRTLFHGEKDSVIIKGLLSKEKTWEKAIYHLLQEYRAKNLENFNMDDEEPDARARRQPASAPPTTRRHVVSHRRKTSVTIAKHSDIARALPTSSTPPRTSPTRARVAPSSGPSSNNSPRPARPSAPTPTKASEGASSIPLVSRPRPAPPAELRLAPRPPPTRAPLGPRPPLSPRTSSDVTTTTVPAIIFQEPSPNRPASVVLRQVQEENTRPESMVSSRPASLGPMDVGSSAPPSPSPLTIPQVQNLDVQRFFHEIAEQLNNIQQGRSSIIVSSPTESLSSPFPPQSPQHLSHPPFRPLTAADAPPSTPITPNGLMDQFEDAENDMSDVASIRSTAPTFESHHSSRTPSTWMENPTDPGYGIGLGIGSSAFPPSAFVAPGQRGRETLRPPASPNTQRWSMASSVASGSSQGGGRVSQYRTPSGSSYESVDEKENVNGGRANSVSYSVPHYRASLDRTPTKATSHSVPAPSAPRVEPMHSYQQHQQQLQQQQNRAPLGDATTSNQSRSRPMPVAPINTNSKTPKKANGRKPVPLDLSTGVLSTPPPSSDPSKRSWFSNLFSFKAPSYSLYSTEGRRTTRITTRNLLESFGVHCTQEGPEHSGSLRCKLDEVKDPAGILTVSKAVKFKVEFSSCTEKVGSASGYVTMVVMVQEKGALSSFKAVHGMVRRDWDLDGPRSGGGSVGGGGRHSPVSSPALGGGFVYV